MSFNAPLFVRLTNAITRQKFFMPLELVHRIDREDDGMITTITAFHACAAGIVTAEAKVKETPEEIMELMGCCVKNYHIAVLLLQKKMVEDYDLGDDNDDDNPFPLWV